MQELHVRKGRGNMTKIVNNLVRIHHMPFRLKTGFAQICNSYLLITFLFRPLILIDGDVGLLLVRIRVIPFFKSDLFLSDIKYLTNIVYCTTGNQ